MSKSNDSCATQTTFTVRELRDDELQKVSGGYTFNNVMVESIVAAQTKTSTACTRMASDDVC
jgi:bacteriocin-like protein